MKQIVSALVWNMMQEIRKNKKIDSEVREAAAVVQEHFSLVVELQEATS
jgi:hypothetical protein